MRRISLIPLPRTLAIAMFSRFSATAWPALVVVLALAACDGEPRLATSMVSQGAATFTAAVDTRISTPPAVIITDQRGRALAGVLVRWQVASGGGSVTFDSVRTDAAGVASAGGWRLGIRAGPQTLSASAPGVSSVTFLATVNPGPPAVTIRRVPETQAAVVGTLVAQPPSLTVADVFENPIAGTTVSFAVVSGGGAIIGSAQRITNDAGVATLDGWRIGTSTAAPQIVTAFVPGLVSLPFRAAAAPEAAVGIEAATSLQQDGVPGFGVTQRPAVRARDRFGNPTGGVTVSFSPSIGSGTVTGSARTTDNAEGLARVGTWVLGTDSTQQLIARSPQFPSDSFVFRANAVASVFFIETVFLKGEPSTRNLQAVERTLQRWRSVIAGQLEPARVIAGAGDCGPGVPALDEVITNVRIYINFDSIDGPGSILGRAGPCIIRTVNGLPVVGFVELDTADLVNLNTNGTLDDVMTHEFGHVLGLQSFNWDRRGLIAGIGGTDPVFQGAVGREQFALLGGAAYTGIPVPLENTGGPGTRDSHWRFNVLRRELMVGFAQPGGMPLSRLSIGALADLGYQVRFENAEVFQVPSFGTAAFGAMVMPGINAVHYGNDEWPSAIWSVERDGRKRLVRDGDWRVTRGAGGRGGGR